jgi:hypothetical protein
MQIIIIFFAIIVLVTFKRTHIPVKGEPALLSMVAITPANSLDMIPADQGLGLDHEYCINLTRSTKATKKKWFAKRWIFRPPLEPV